MEPATSGFEVSPYPNRSRGFDAHEFGFEDLVRYAIDHRDLLELDNHFLGGWHDSDSRTIFLDVSIVLEDREEAIALAQRTDQIAIFDLDREETVLVNRDATSGGQRRADLPPGDR